MDHEEVMGTLYLLTPDLLVYVSHVLSSALQPTPIFFTFMVFRFLLGKHQSAPLLRDTYDAAGHASLLGGVT